MQAADLSILPRKPHYPKFISSISLFISSIIYAAALVYCLAEYAAVEWPEYGFSYGGVSIFDVCVLCVALAIWAAVLPQKIHRPSSLFLIVTYLFVCVPALVAMVGLEGSSEDFYYPLLFSLTLGFALACLVTRSFSWQGLPRKDSAQLLPFFVIAWVVCLAVLVLSFGSVMSFSGLDDIYAQREQGKATNLFEGYVQTYFGYVFSPAILAFGLVRKSYFLAVTGVLGSVVLYMITAEKAVFMYPLFMISLFLVLRSRSGFFLSPSIISLSFSALLLLATLLYSDSAIASFVAWYLGVRSLLVPGTFIAHYSAFFNDFGYTLGTHITGINMLIEVPVQFASHPRWPSIGHLVGEDYLGIPTLNANASFIASDGVASFGVGGVIIIMMLFSLFLVVLDRVARGVQPSLSLVLLLPLALTLTNGSIFTALLSFGGFLFLFVFAFLFNRNGDAEYFINNPVGG